MNAILHEECEAPVLTNEAIEVHLSYLRPSVEDVKAEQYQLRKEIKALDEKLTGKIDAIDEKLTGKIEALDEKLRGGIRTLDGKLSGEISTLDGKFRALDEKFSDKMDSLADRLMKVQASQNGLKWFIGSLALIVSGVSIARSLGWI